MDYALHGLPFKTYDTLLLLPLLTNNSSFLQPLFLSEWQNLGALPNLRTGSRQMTITSHPSLYSTYSVRTIRFLHDVGFRPSQPPDGFFSPALELHYPVYPLSGCLCDLLRSCH